ncbi:pyridoxamine 5'-phosphate oxidase family protein [Frondihabitans australicus]|uniref:General stress protein 26 n=1 Tax=Frondihabitans australicus TaxID=386892 RepID=A0A495IIA1_9MICO|nr:pyridoxamine 5'-phosphate oxidase family protein [Frondihabitans australicus]RKR75717.1 general stress protein 26 [Frondihabitans australicus]
MSADTATPEELQTVADVLGKARIGLLATVDQEGHVVSRPLALIDRDFDGSVWFFVQKSSHKVHDIEREPEVNVGVETSKGWLSISGTAQLTTDPQKVDELWNTGAEAWFDQGRQDPEVALLEVRAHTVESWTSTEPKAVTLFKYAKAAATGGHPENVGENTTISL